MAEAKPTEPGTHENPPAVAAPWELFAGHAGRPYAFFLDRAGSERLSFAGSEPVAQLLVDRDGSSRVWRDGEWTRVDGDPIEAIAAFVEDCAASLGEQAPRLGGWSEAATLPRTVGYLAYELGRFVERVPPAGHDPVGTPLAVLSTYDRFDVWDPNSRTLTTHEFEAAPAGGAKVPYEDDRLAPEDGWSSTPDDLYEAGFARVMAAISAGEIYQANLSRAMSFTLDGSAEDLYRRLRARQPVPYGAFADCGGFKLLSNSPECFLSVAGDRVATYPIKGTRPRSPDAVEDARLQRELAGDPKELAEHIMIVDLERNDLGRVCRTGSIAVSGQAQVQSFATLHHMVSCVEGRLRSETALDDLLRACFPGGSITGTPKVKAMEIISEVERRARGVYTGAVGCMNGGRSIDLNVAIRTAVCAGPTVHYASGGGIVADSHAQSEYEETVTKALAFRRALEGASS